MLDKRLGDHVAVFPDGSTFPVRFYQTTDLFALELPCGTYESETFPGLRAILREEFEGARILPTASLRRSGS